MDLTRVEYVIGKENIARLKAAHVAVVGLGGVGSYIAEALARSGVGALTLVDADTVASSNINRQLPALLSTMGRRKTEVIAERIADINPDCHVTLRSSFYEPGDFDKFFTEKPDYVADAIDSTASKIDLLKECYFRNIQVISSMGTGNKLDPSCLTVSDISKTHTCPLAKSVRRRLRQIGIERGITVVFSTEQPVRSEQADVPGSMVFVPASSGLLIASYIMRQLIKL